jgi:hypothetical protein
MTCNPFNTGVTKLFAECKYLLAYKMRFVIVLFQNVLFRLN